jgi:Putative Flp pilus-assembly TadE/G-like
MLRNVARKFLSNKSGNFAMIFGLTLLPIMFVSGIALDYSGISRERSRLQETADSAAIFAVKQLENAGYSESDLMGEAKDVVVANFDIAGNVTTDVDLDPANNILTVDLTKGYVPSFLQIMRPGPFDMHVTAKVNYDETLGGRKCIVTLSPTGKGVFSFNGNANIEARNCSVHVNSASADAVDLNGNAFIHSAENCFVGGVQSGLAAIDPPPLDYCRPIPYPFKDYATPTVGPCTYTNMKVKGKTANLTPGVYCGGLDVASGVDVTLAPGLYIIKDGRFKTTGNVTITGNKVTFYFVGNNVALQFSGGTEFSLIAMDQATASLKAGGKLAGFIVFFDQNATSTYTNAFSGGDFTYFEGVMNFGYHDLDINGNGEVNSHSPYSGIVANTIILNGNGTINFTIDPNATNLPILEELYYKQILVRLIE